MADGSQSHGRGDGETGRVGRRDVLKTAGLAGTAGMAGLAGCIGLGGGGGNGGPDTLIVIGYPEDGIQLFRDFYNETGDDQDLLVPDGLRDPDLPDQVGNDMSNVIGTAPAAGGPNQQAFTSLFENEYGESPGVFTSQSYDSVAIQVLANAAAGENDGTAIRDQMRRLANPGGMNVGPSNFAAGVEAAANGEDVNYQGASSSVNFDQNGDPAAAAYALWEFSDGGTSQIRTENFQSQNPEGSGPTADSGPGGMDRSIKVGILLPETGSLASVGGPMIQAAQLPALQVNQSNLNLEVATQVEDTQTNSQAGVTAANSLINAGYPSVCGSASSGVNVPVSQEVFIPNEVVGCSPSSTALSVTNLEDDDYIFRTAPSDRLQGLVMAQVAAEEQEAETAATLYVNNDYGQQLSDRFAQVFQNEHEGEVLQKVAFNQDESSYSSVVSEALSG